MAIMDEDDIDIQTWRRTQLGEEPIYCAAPPPSNPDDIIYYGSDEELDESARVAKKLKYEAQALRYLEGKPMRILSAGLRGPFDKASGWENPWLPKQPTAKKPVLEPSQLPTKPLPAVKQHFLRRSRRLAQQDDTTPGTDSSMRCQLPSSGSSWEFTSPLGTDKRMKIKAWAKEVSLGTLERDPFWAPDQVLHEENATPDRKRPVEKDWLKGKQPKRKRLDSSQNTAIPSTPMPMPRAQASTRSRSVPTNIGHVKPPVPPSMAASRSFELATPPSTVNQNGPEITPVEPGLPIAATCPQLTQTGTPESPSHADAITIAVVEEKEQSEEIISKNQQIDGSDIRMSQDNQIIGLVVPEGTELSERQGTPAENAENADPMPIKSDGASATSGTISSLSMGDEVTETKEPDAIHDVSHVPPTVVEMKPSRDSVSPINRTTVEAHLIKSEPLVEEGSALVDDPMDTDRKEQFAADESPTAHDALNIPTMPIPEPLDAMQEDCGNIAQDELGSESNSIIIPLSQLEWGITEAIGGTPKKLGVVAEDEIKSSDDSPTQATLSHCPEIVTQRSPWVPDLPPGADLTIDYINGETSQLGPSQQSPWAGELLGSIRSSGREHHVTAPTGTVPADTGSGATALGEPQSPWDTGNTSIPPYPKRVLISSPLATYNETSLHPPSQPPMLADELEQRSLICSPTTPPRAPTSHARTPELEKSIMPFSMLNTPSPKRRPRQLSSRYSSTGPTRSILSSGKRSNPWNSGRSSRRVTFAPLPTDEDDNVLPASASAPGALRAASPPPQAMADAKDEDVDGRYQNHFDAVKRRANGEDVQLRVQPQLLPSFSQQKLSSPAFNAMAAAFREADAYMGEERVDISRDIEESPDQEMVDAEQSPWRKESQDVVDDVADVMNNLDDFLGAFNVEAELEKERQEPIRGSQNWRILG
ncbi:26S protease regulatory subunit 8 [Hypoxylon texense]